MGPRFPKPRSHLLATARTLRLQRALSKSVKRAVMERDQHRCRVCGARATSVHELRFCSIGGQVALSNSIATCGSGTSRCHGQLQRNELIPIGHPNGVLRFLDNQRGRKTMAFVRQLRRRRKTA